ncbi:MAG: D-Ala-D-Ala carboxypeptidase [Candidatus Poribacteria bacterium]|nr:MAG: D-Ala-D-Ala carboxypeptidase [Candidatus Poribacteria bacterium]
MFFRTGGIWFALVLVGLVAWAEPQAALVMEFDTGRVLYAQRADQEWPPASLAKMMLSYVVLDAVAAGKVSLETPIRASALAARTGGSQVYLREGEIFPLGELMAAIEIASANDASVAVAEGVFGSVEAAVQQMNAKAQALGLEKTRFVNVHGLPESDPNGDRITAREAAVLARALLRDHPEVLHWTATVHAPFRGGKFRLYSTNAHFLSRFPGADGLKTGYHSRARYNLVATAVREGMRLIAVVLGCNSSRDRTEAASALLEDAFRRYERRVILRTGDSLPDLVYVGGSREEYVPLIVREPLVLALPRTAWTAVRFVPRGVPLLEAPVSVGDPAGELVALLDGEEVGSVPLSVGRSVDPAPVWWRLLHQDPPPEERLKPRTSQTPTREPAQ